MRQKPLKLTPKSLAEWIKQGGKGRRITSPDVTAHFGVSRATAARILKMSVESGDLVREGSTKNAVYMLPVNGSAQTASPSLKLEKRLKGLAEDLVFDEVSLKLALKKSLSQNTFRIAQYAFSEMLNNAIDHSEADRASVQVAVDKGRFEFTIRDRGIGIFKKLRRTFQFKSDEEAIEHLLKGKQTTAPEAHSGQGIFFTSKIADRFVIKSETFELKIDNEIDDLSLGVIRKLKGTEVSFQIKSQTRKSLEKLFKEYANEDFEFDRSKYPMRILEQTGSVSRSQARRITFGLEKFERIIFDFSRVKEIGQGFADELFRVFQNRYPAIVLETRGANAAVDFMIRRARKAPTSTNNGDR